METCDINEWSNNQEKLVLSSFSLKKKKYIVRLGHLQLVTTKKRLKLKTRFCQTPESTFPFECTLIHATNINI